MHRPKLSKKGRVAGQAFFLSLSNCGISASGTDSHFTPLSGNSPLGKQIKTEKSKICCEAALKCNNTPTDMLACRVVCFAFNPARKMRALFDFSSSAVGVQTSFTRRMAVDNR